jgi:hypothetical protein
MTFGTDALIRLEDLPPTISRIEQPISSSPPPSRGAAVIPGTFAQAERDLISRAPEACKWNKVHAAAMLKISCKKLYAKFSKYQLERPDDGRDHETWYLHDSGPWRASALWSRKHPSWFPRPEWLSAEASLLHHFGRTEATPMCSSNNSI